jgi:transposase
MPTRKTYRPWNPEQSFLLPPSPAEWLPEGHLAYFILDVVRELDLSAIEAPIQEKDPRGERPYDPAMMLALLLYGYCVGVFSSRRIERATYEDVAFRVVAGGQHPHFTRINAFRRTHLTALEGLFRQVLLLCRRAGLVKLGHVALDGTKVQANASKHKAMSYERMQEAERRLEAEVADLMARAEQADAEEDKRFGEGQRDEDLPAELRRRQERLDRIRKAKTELEAEAREVRAARHRELATGCDERATSSETERQRRLNATLAEQHRQKAGELSEQDDDDEPPFTTADGLPKHQPRTTTSGKPHPKAQRNFTDPDSRIMERGGEFLQGYNCQAVVDGDHQIVVAEAVTNQPPDAENLEPMLRLCVENCGEAPQQLSADSGFWNATVIDVCTPYGTDPYVAIERQKHGEHTPEPPSTPPTDEDEVDAREKMRRKLRTPEGRAVYARRKAIVEPVFGQIKEARGFRRFLLRGLAAVQAEWSLLCTTHNLLKLFGARRKQATTPA